jgi:enterochelin esterase-like enzyme
VNKWRVALAVGVVAGLVLAVAALARRWPFAVDRHGAVVSHFFVRSRFVHARLRATLVEPAGAAGQTRPLLVFLHGRGMTEDGSLNAQMFAALAAQGERAPDIVFPDGGDHSYWHDRHGAAWGRYVMREVIPQAIKRLGADPKRVAIGGISMGGFGAFDLARLHPGSFCAVGGHSPAIWQSSGETAPGAFDNASDFARNDIVRTARSHPSVFAGKPLWLDAGTADPFDPGDRAFVAALRSGAVKITVHRWPGGHTGSYWRSHWRNYLGFYARALANCDRS